MNELAKIVSLIINGEVVIIPTEYAYVYACDPFNEEAITRLKTLNKSQEINQTPTILVGDLKDIPNLLQSFEPDEEQKAVKNWAGNVNIEFKHPSNWLNKELLSKDKKATLRLPEQDYVLEILHSVGQPLATIDMYDETRLVRDSLALKNSKIPFLKTPHSLSGILPKKI